MDYNLRDVFEKIIDNVTSSPNCSIDLISVDINERNLNASFLTKNKETYSFKIENN